MFSSRIANASYEHVVLCGGVTHHLSVHRTCRAGAVHVRCSVVGFVGFVGFCAFCIARWFRGWIEISAESRDVRDSPMSIHLTTTSLHRALCV